MLRELWEKKGAERHGVLMGMFEGMGWEGEEVRQWRRERSMGEGIELGSWTSGA